METNEVVITTASNVPAGVLISNIITSSIPVLPSVPNEYSNLSSGGSMSNDRDLESAEKPLVGVKYSKSLERKAPRKRKRLDEQRQERKITECFRVCFFSYRSINILQNFILGFLKEYQFH